MRKKVRRLHSEDARFLREMFILLDHKIFELEVAVGELQRGRQAGTVNEDVVEEVQNDA